MGRGNGKASGFEEIIATVARDVGAELADALPELSEAVKTSESGASVSFTLQVKPDRKRDGFKASLSCRVRAPRPSREYAMRIGTKSGQLELGLGPEITKDDGEEALHA